MVAQKNHIFDITSQKKSQVVKFGDLGWCSANVCDLPKIDVGFCSENFKQCDGTPDC